MAQQPAVQRPDPRPEMRADPRDTRVRERKRKNDADPFYISDSIIPDGMTYEWKRKSTFGQEDVSHQMHMQENGWDPVDASRHPGYMPAGYSGAIERSGMVLMERPVELTNEARDEDYRNARAVVLNNESQLQHAPTDTLPRDHKLVKPNVRKTVEPHRTVPE